MDRLQKIRKGWEGFHKADSLTLAQAMSDIVWLANEVERLRKIEDEIRFLPVSDHFQSPVFDSLVATLVNNPRPDSTS